MHIAYVPTDLLKRSMKITSQRLRTIKLIV